MEAETIILIMYIWGAVTVWMLSIVALVEEFKDKKVTVHVASTFYGICWPIVAPLVIVGTTYRVWKNWEKM